MLYLFKYFYIDTRTIYRPLKYLQNYLYLVSIAYKVSKVNLFMFELQKKKKKQNTMEKKQLIFNIVQCTYSLHI